MAAAAWSLRLPCSSTWPTRGIPSSYRLLSDRDWRSTVASQTIEVQEIVVGIKTISSREVYRNPWTSVREDVIERANGQRGIYGVIDKDPACIVIPLDHTPQGDFVYL